MIYKQEKQRFICSVAIEKRLELLGARPWDNLSRVTGYFLLYDLCLIKGPVVFKYDFLPIICSR